MNLNIDTDAALTKRTMALGIVAAIAAMPLVWLNIDANAGDKLLKLTSSAPRAQVVQR